jgi:hypothetical protein
MNPGSSSAAVARQSAQASVLIWHRQETYFLREQNIFGSENSSYAISTTPVT